MGEDLGAREVCLMSDLRSLMGSYAMFLSEGINPTKALGIKGYDWMAELEGGEA